MENRPIDVNNTNKQRSECLFGQNKSWCLIIFLSFFTISNLITLPKHDSPLLQ